jgi:intein-encoded DNA endonuclease-like protein
MRKPRSDSKLLNLPEEQRGEILDLMETGLSYKELRGAIHKEFGERCSPALLSHFYRREKAKRLINRRLDSFWVAH